MSSIAVLAVPSAAFGQTSSDSSSDIIVTARRVDERLQDVPISITVLDQKAISNRNIVNAGDLGAYVPSLSTNNSYGPERTTFTIRGFTQENKTAPSVGVYFADVVAPRSTGGTSAGNGAGAGSFFDLQNAQVLKGPQGTLFGRNTTGGAILLVPQKPTDRLEGYVEASLGSYDLRRVQAVLNAPLSDTFRIRAGVDVNKRDGYLRNRNPVGPDRFRDTDYVAARLSIVGDLTPDLETYTIGTYSRSANNGTVPKYSVCNRTLSNAFAAGTAPAGFFAFLSCNQVDRQNAAGYGFWDVENNHPAPELRIEQWQAINTTTWRAADNLTIKNILSYAEYRERVAFSLAGDNFLYPGTTVPVAPFAHLYPGATGDNSAQSTFTEELQFQGKSGDGRFDWQAGAYLEVSKPLGFNTGLAGIFLYCSDIAAFRCTDPLGFGTISSSNTEDSFNTKGLYAQATYDLSDKLSFTGGIRYTVDKIGSVAQNLNIAIGPGGTPVLFCQNRLLFNGGNLQTPLFVNDQTQCRSSESISSKKPTWLLGMDFKPNADTLIYAKYSRGYRQGGINPNNIGIEKWGPEKVDNYEAGLKASFRGAISGFLNVAAFYSDFSNQQLAVSLQVKPEFQGAIPPAQGIVNAGKSRIYGLEIDAGIKPFRGLSLDVGYAYLNTRLQSITLPAAPFVYAALLPNASPGDPLALSPKNRVTLTGSYTLPLEASIGEITFSANYTHTDANNAVSPAASPLYRLEQSDLLNLNLTWTSVLGQPVDATFFVTNATNEKRILFPTTSYNAIGGEGGQTNEPRMWGVRLKYRFGS